MVTTQAQCEPWLQAGEAAITRFNETVLGGAGEDKPNDEIWKEFCKNQKP